MNLLYIFADQMSAHAMGCAGNPDVKTPHLDRLAAQGCRLESAVSVCPVCTPHRASLLTGQYPTAHGLLDNDVPLDVDIPGFPHVLRDAGYRMGYIGKWHLFGNSLATRTSFIPPGKHRYGFDDYWAVMNCEHNYLQSSAYLNDDETPVTFDGYEPDVQTDLALEFLRNGDGRPFSLFLSWGPPHDPYDQVPQCWKDLYDPDSLSFRPNVDPDEDICIDGLLNHSDYTPITFTETGSYPRWFRKKPDKEQIRDHYAHISALDSNVGRLMEFLDQAGLAENTLVVFTADHGDMLFSHGLCQKGYPHAESALVPFIARLPSAIPAGTVSRKPLGTVDIMPTLLSMIGLPAPDHAQGRDLSCLLRAIPGDIPDVVYMMYGLPWRMPEWRGIKTENHTYAMGPEGSLCLYDDTQDPYQLCNLAGRPEHESTESRLRERTRQLMAEIHDPFDRWPAIRDRVESIRRDWSVRYAELCKANG